MEQRIFKRKIYDKIPNWKKENNGKTALLIEEARRVGIRDIGPMFHDAQYLQSFLLDTRKKSFT